MEGARPVSRAQAIKSLRRAVDALRAARSDVAGWADDVRQDAEARMGVPALDPGVRADAEYGAALDKYTAISDALDVLLHSQALADWLREGGAR